MRRTTPVVWGTKLLGITMGSFLHHSSERVRRALPWPLWGLKTKNNVSFVCNALDCLNLPSNVGRRQGSSTALVSGNGLSSWDHVATLPCRWYRKNASHAQPF